MTGGIEYGDAVGGVSFAGRRAPATKSAPITDGDELVVTACRYGVLHQGKGGRWEIFAPGCFARTLASKQAVRLMVDHDETQLLGTRADDVKFESDSQELQLRCKIAASRAGEKIKTAVLEGRREASVGYLTMESVDRVIDGKSVTIICDAQLLEVSLVHHGAVPGTKAEIRSGSSDSLARALQELSDAMDRKNRAMRLLLESL